MSENMKVGRFEGRMRRSDFWYRMIPMNVLYNIAVRLTDNYYTGEMESGMGKLIKEVEAAGDNASEQLIGDFLTQVYGYILPLVGWLVLADIIYYFITAPWYVKRFHDVGMSGGWLSLSIIASIVTSLGLLLSPLIPYSYVASYFVAIPVSIFVLICCGLRDSQYAANRYGESPKYGKYKQSKLPTIPKES